MKKYSWKFNISGVDPELVGAELEEIESQGELTPERVLGYAEIHKDSELYKCFEWDDKEASRKYRIEQATRVLCSISLEIKEEPVVKQRVYVNVRSSSSGTKTFKNIRDVLADDEEYQQVIQKAKREFELCKEKYENIINTSDLKDIIFDIYREI